MARFLLRPKIVKVTKNQGNYYVDGLLCKDPMYEVIVMCPKCDCNTLTRDGLCESCGKKSTFNEAWEKSKGENND